jgi:hypothetical protein
MPRLHTHVALAVLCVMNVGLSVTAENCVSFVSLKIVSLLNT